MGDKLGKRVAGAGAMDTSCKGVDRPVKDLSRGCRVDDIVSVVAITAVQAQQNDKTGEKK